MGSCLSRECVSSWLQRVGSIGPCLGKTGGSLAIQLSFYPMTNGEAVGGSETEKRLQIH